VSAIGPFATSFTAPMPLDVSGWLRRRWFGPCGGSPRLQERYFRNDTSWVRITAGMMRSLRALGLAAAILCFGSRSALPVEITELAGAQHGYPALCELSGKKLADGEFRQWIDSGKLHVVITYKFPDGQLFEDSELFLQQPELIQEQWSWKESKDGKPQREFAVDFHAKIARAQIISEDKDVSGSIDVEPGRTFAGFGFSIALSNLRARIVRGDQIELKTIGFAPKPLLKALVVPVKIWHASLDKMQMAGRAYEGDNFVIRPELPFVAKIFVRVPDTHIWLTTPRPAGFLRWEGPIVLPNDPMIRVDLISDAVGGPAKPLENQR
jgi:hypothetical protein